MRRILYVSTMSSPMGDAELEAILEVARGPQAPGGHSVRLANGPLARRAVALASGLMPVGNIPIQPVENWQPSSISF